uniref:Uncharacterized protein n=1 Tax=Seriola lalandi dorsalis TaxID=1841481 RepID=A0A3B4XG26_SERLL
MSVTVVTVASDSKSLFPPLCQILKHLCSSPLCCSEDKGLMQTDVTAALGTIQIMVGLFHIGLEPGRTPTHPEDLTDMGAAYWLGAVYIAVGIMSVLAGQCPSLCLVGFAVFLNIVGSVIAFIGIVLYAIDLGEASVIWMCDDTWNSHSPDKCRYMASFAQVSFPLKDKAGFILYLLGTMISMDITLIVLAALQMCVCISFTVLGVKALVNRKKEELLEDQHHCG